MDIEALLVLSFGGPEKPDDVMPFLENVLRGRNVPRERMLEVAEHYYHFGGKSPINDQNRALIASLRELLDAEGPHVPIYWGNRNWNPFLVDTMRQMRPMGFDGLWVSSHRRTVRIQGAASIGKTLRGRRRKSARARRKSPSCPPFHAHPRFIAANVENLRAALSEFSCPPHVAFTAHSVPMSMTSTSPYVRQLEETRDVVADGLG